MCSPDLVTRSKLRHFIHPMTHRNGTDHHMIAPFFSRPIQIILIAAAVGATLQAQTITVEPIFFGMHCPTGGLRQAAVAGCAAGRAPGLIAEC